VGGRNEMKVYLAEYCSLTYEGAWSVLGVCKTPELAQSLIEKHEKKIIEEDGKEYEWKQWMVSEFDIIETEEEVDKIIKDSI